MKSNIKRITAGALVGVLCGSSIAFSKEGLETLTAVYRDIKIIVDGTTIDPKDGVGNPVEPFIANGTTYLPVRAVANAFNKPVDWDGEEKIVFLGDKVDIPKKEVPMYNRPYLECTKASQLKFGEDKGASYIRCIPDSNELEIANDPDTRTVYTDSVTYSTLGIAKAIKGEFYLTGDENTEGVLHIYDQNGKELYTSPIVRTSTAPIPFEVDISNEIAIKLEFEATCEYGGDGRYLYIKNPVLVTSDY